MRCLLTLTLIALFAATEAVATKGPCTDDRLKFCKDTKTNLDDIRSCLLQHKDELSGPCAARLVKPAARPQEPIAPPPAPNDQHRLFSLSLGTVFRRTRSGLS